MLYSIRLALAVGIDELGDNQRVIRDTIRLGNGERVTLYSFYWSPYINDLHSRLEKLVCIIREVEGHAGERSFV